MESPDTTTKLRERSIMTSLKKGKKTKIKCDRWGGGGVRKSPNLGDVIFEFFLIAVKKH